MGSRVTFSQGSRFSLRDEVARHSGRQRSDHDSLARSFLKSIHIWLSPLIPQGSFPMKSWILGFAAAIALLALPQTSSALISDYFFQQQSGSAADMTGAITAIAAGNDDIAVGPLPIGFNFELDGVVYNTFSASSNGFLHLGAHNANSALGNGFVA